MKLEDVQISFVGMDPTDALKKYVLEKLGKFEHLWKESTSIEVFFKENVSARGVRHDFRVDINIYLPNSAVRVESSGESMYANIDEATDVLSRRLKRYHDRKSFWEGATPWKVLEADANLITDGSEELEDYAGYVPTVSVRKKIKDMSPLEEGEAIERMELLGYSQLLFRNKSTGKISMIYRRDQGGYGLVEPDDNGLE